MNEGEDEEKREEEGEEEKKKDEVDKPLYFSRLHPPMHECDLSSLFLMIVQRTYISVVREKGDIALSFVCILNHTAISCRRRKMRYRPSSFLTGSGRNSLDRKRE